MLSLLIVQHWMASDNLAETPYRKDAIMLQLPAGREASRSERASQYERHRPEQTLLYNL